MTANDGWPELAARTLADHLQLQDLAASIQGDGVELGFGGARCRIRESEGSIPPPLVPLWFDAYLPDHDLTISDSLSGPGANPNESVLSSVHQFIRGTLAPIGHLYGVPLADDHVARARVTSTSAGVVGEWELLFGEPIVYGADVAEVRATIAAIRERAFLIDVLDPVAGLLADRRLHWCKAFLARLPGRGPLGQVTLDNVESREAFDLLKQRELPGSGQILARQFALLRPTP